MAPVGQTWPHRVQVKSAVAQAGDQPRGVEAFQAGFPEHGLQAVGEADLHALAAADAAGQKLRFVLGPRGADQEFVRPPGQGAQAQQGHQGHAGPQSGDHLAPAQVQGCPGGFEAKCKGHPALLTGCLAIQAELALGGLVPGHLHDRSVPGPGFLPDPERRPSCRPRRSPGSRGRGPWAAAEAGRSGR